MTAPFLTYVFYILATLHLFIVLRKGLAILFHKEAPGNKDTNSFSVIVAAHNEAQNLKQLIPLLLSQHYTKYEVIIALDRCTDDSLQVVNSFSDVRLKALDIHEVPSHFHGKKYALTHAIHAAKNEWILLTDADCRPVSDLWITGFNKTIKPATEIILGISPYSRSSGLLNALIRYETFQTAFNYLSSAIAGKPYMGVGRNLAYKKSLFMHMEGFGEFKHITGGDDDLFVQTHANRVNTQLVLDPQGLTYSDPKRKWKEYLQQKTRHLSVGKHYRSKIKGKHFFDMSVHLLLWLSFLYLIFIYPGPWRIIGMFILLLLVKGIFFIKIAKKTGLAYSIVWYPIVDFLFAVVMPLIGTRAVFVKNIRWS